MVPQSCICVFVSSDIDECVLMSLCAANASCTNTIGSYLCMCDQGYTGDGLTCASK